MMALDLIFRESPSFNFPSYLPLAKQANCREFISSKACQHTVQLEWSGDVECNDIVVPVVCLCPFLIYWNKLVAFRSIRYKRKHLDDQAPLPQPGSELSCKEKLVKFYCAPRAKFSTHAVSLALAHSLLLDVLYHISATLLVYLAIWHETKLGDRMGDCIDGVLRRLLF